MKLKLAFLLLAAAALFSSTQARAQAAPAVATTLDVCQDLVTGQYNYSGVVAVRADAANLSASYAVQNRTSAAGYADALQLAPAATAQAAGASGARVLAFAGAAAPLTLGSLRNAAQVTLYDALDPSRAPLRLQATYELASVVCGCQVKGCVLTQGYWSNKPGVVWPAPFSRTAPFFSGGLTWQQILDTPPKGGNAYIILAHQYIAARLNIAAGASAPSSIQAIISQATTFFASGANLDTCSAEECETQKTWAGILDTYNNGLYPGAPKHCPD